MKALAELSDEDLMQRYIEGGAKAFDTLYLRHKAKVYAYIRKRTGNDKDAEDLFQKVFMKFHRSRYQYDRQYPLTQWLFTISRSVVLDFRKKPSLAASEYKDDIHGSTQALENVLLEEQKQKNTERLEQIVQNANLSELERTIISLKHLQGMPFTDVSNIAQVSQVNARKIASRALGKVKRSLALNK